MLLISEKERGTRNWSIVLIAHIFGLITYQNWLYWSSAIGPKMERQKDLFCWKWLGQIQHFRWFVHSAASLFVLYRPETFFFFFFFLTPPKWWGFIVFSHFPSSMIPTQDLTVVGGGTFTNWTSLTCRLSQLQPVINCIQNFDIQSKENAKQYLMHFNLHAQFIEIIVNRNINRRKQL